MVNYAQISVRTTHYDIHMNVASSDCFLHIPARQAIALAPYGKLCVLNLLAPELFFLNSAPPVYKM